MELTYGYTVDAEFCGRPQPMFVVRQYGVWLGAFASAKAAVAAVTEQGGQLAGSGWTDENLVADLMAQLGEYEPDDEEDGTRVRLLCQACINGAECHCDGD